MPRCDCATTMQATTALFSTPSERWAALQRRDPAANSAFLYGVHSTRIYCRPTCPGRLARRANIVFFDSLQEAQQSGYRPCKRCQPCNDGWSRNSQSQQLVEHAKDIIIAAVMEHKDWTVEGVAKEVNISGGHLHRLFKKYLHSPPKAFAAALSINSASAPATLEQGAPSPSVSQKPTVDTNCPFGDEWPSPTPYDSDRTSSSGGEWHAEEYLDMLQYDLEQNGSDLSSFLLWDFDMPLSDDYIFSTPLLPNLETPVVEPQ